MKSLLCVIKTSLIVCRTTTRLQPRRNPAVASGAKVKQLSFSYRKAGNVLEVFDDPSDVDHSELAKIAIRDCANAPRRPRSAEAEYKKFLKIALSTDQSVKPKYFHDLEGKFFRARRCWLNCDANHVNLHSPATSDVTRAVNLPKTAFPRWTGGAIGETRNWCAVSTRPSCTSQPTSTARRSRIMWRTITYTHLASFTVARPSSGSSLRHGQPADLRLTLKNICACAGNRDGKRAWDARSLPTTAPFGSIWAHCAHGEFHST